MPMLSDGKDELLGLTIEGSDEKASFFSDLVSQMPFSLNQANGLQANPLMFRIDKGQEGRVTNGPAASDFLAAVTITRVPGRVSWPAAV